MIATACLAGGWVWARRGNVWLGGALIAIGTIKPQISILVVLWLFLERRWKVLSIATAFAFLMSLPEILAAGPVGAFTGWLSAVGRYQLGKFNQVGFIHLFGLKNFLDTAGVHVPSLVPVGVASTIGLWWLRKRIADPDILPLLMGVTLIFSYSHDYDLWALVLLIPAFWRHLRGREVEVLIAGLMVFLLFVPQRLFWPASRPQVVVSAPLTDVLLAQYRVLVVLGLVVWLLVMTIRQSSDLHSTHGTLFRTR
jgi:hypothetical protein